MWTAYRRRWVGSSVHRPRETIVAAAGLLLGAAIGVGSAYAQSVDLIVPLAEAAAAADSAASARVDKLRQRPTTKSLTLVQVNTGALQADSPRVALPGAQALTLELRVRVAIKKCLEIILQIVLGKAVLLALDERGQVDHRQAVADALASALEGI